MGNTTIVGIVIDHLDFVFGLIVGLIGSVRAWRQRKVELKAKLYYPLFIACYNLLLLFDNIEKYRDKETQGQGIDLYDYAVKHLDDIMNSSGMAVNLKGGPKDQEKDYLSMFFEVKRIVDLNQNSIKKNWSEATIWFENGKDMKYTGNDERLLAKIEEFGDLYTNLSSLKQLCVNKEKTLKGRTL